MWRRVCCPADEASPSATIEVVEDAPDRHLVGDEGGEAHALAARREKNRLKGKGQIGLRLGRVLHRFKMGKHFHLEIGETSFRFERNQDRIAEEAALDGICVIRTSVDGKRLGPEDAVACYKRLAVVERAFRSLKTMDLRVRPIHHHLGDRVRAHILICMLAYYVEWHMRRALALILFDDDDPTGAASRRTSTVAKAHRSSKAESKAHTRIAPDGSPVHGFQTLLRDLATLTQNRIQPKDRSTPPFDILTTPTPLQQRAFDLLGVSPRM